MTLTSLIRSILLAKPLALNMWSSVNFEPRYDMVTCGILFATKGSSIQALWVLNGPQTNQTLYLVSDSLATKAATTQQLWRV